MKRVLVLTAMENLALSVLRSLGDRGLRVGVAGAGGGALLRLSRHCAAYTRVARDGTEMTQAGARVLAAAERAAREFAADLILPVDVAGAYLAARLKERMAAVPYFPSPTPAVLGMLDDKWSFYRMLVEHGLPTPRTRLLEDAAAAATLRAPIVIKPTADSGGRGVTIALSAAQLRERLDGAVYPLLAQEYVEGEDVDISFLADRGRLLAWAVQLRSKGGTIHYIEDARALALGRQLAETSSFTGIAHVDMRYEGRLRERVLVIECNPRFWGTFSYALGLGTDFLGLGLELALGGSPAPMTRTPVGSSPSLRDAIVNRFRGRDMSGDCLEHVRQKLSDPAPELLRMVRRLIGVPILGP